MPNIVAQFALENALLPHHFRRIFQADECQSGIVLRGPARAQSGDHSLVLSGKPRFGDVLESIDTIATRVLTEYQQGSTAFLARLRGSFALAAYDASRKSALIAIDRMGIEPLAWGRADGRLIVANSAADVARIRAPSPELNPQVFFDFMLNHMVPAPDTAFVGVRKLLPGTAIEFSRKGLNEFRFWEPDFSRTPSTSVNDLMEATLPTLRRAVELTGVDDETGTFLSGGLDSSTVTGLLADVQKHPSRAFSVGFGVAEYDELAYARIASTHFGCEHFEYEVTPDDVVNLIERIAAAYDEPFGNSSAVPTLSCALFARENGVTHLLAGDGGDELFGGNERYTRQRIFEYYRRIPGPLRRYIFDPLADALDPEDSWLPLRKFSSYVHQARIDLPERFESWNLIYREGPPRVFGRDFLQTIDIEYPLQRMQRIWDSCPSTDLLDKMLWYDWKFTLADNDLRKVSRMCASAGVRVSFPMLDDDFVSLSMKITSGQKMAGNELRSFFKKAVGDFLPPDIISKQKHGFGLPFGQWLRTHDGLQELVFGSLKSLEKRDIFDPTFLARVTEEHRHGHASYYGYAIWDLVMLEQWLLANERPQALTKID